MITYQEAVAIATDYLKPDEKNSLEFAIIEEATIEKPYGWIFFYQTKRYLETKQFRDAAFGTEPFIVEASTGKISFLRGRSNIDFPFDGNYNELLGLRIAYEDRFRENSL